MYNVLLRFMSQLFLLHNIFYGIHIKKVKTFDIFSRATCKISSTTSLTHVSIFLASKLLFKEPE